MGPLEATVTKTLSRLALAKITSFVASKAELEGGFSINADEVPDALVTAYLTLSLCR
jgi:hypothetical protein